MHLPYVRRVVLALSVLMLTTSCGGGDERAAQDGPATARAAGSQAPQAAPLSEAELAARSLAPQDLPDHKVEEALQGAVISADRPECRDLATLLLGGVMTNTLGQVHTKATKGTTETKVSLHSWPATKAHTVITDVLAGGQACGGGFNAVRGTEKVKITKVANTPSASGDESVAYTAEQELDGEKSTIEVVLVRKNTTTAGFTAISPSEATDKPTAIVAAQLKKLS
ncbi:hypothetical protein [Streptomyces sp. NPDC048551]|uniref:hypothetical protein n=1 Tax=Streptomyces sp. NPDC048551 TaxID=3155758 RepID=UPI0034266968